MNLIKSNIQYRVKSTFSAYWKSYQLMGIIPSKSVAFILLSLPFFPPIFALGRILIGPKFFRVLLFNNRSCKKICYVTEVAKPSKNYSL